MVNKKSNNSLFSKINSLSLPVTILIASLVIGGFYYASEANKQKSIEKQQEIKIQEEKTKIDQAKQKQSQAKQALDTCLADAETDYSDWWYQACKTKGLLTNRCISLHDMTLEEYAKEKGIPDDKRFTVFSDFYKEKDDCSCLLPQYNADSIDKSRQDRKDICLKQYPQ